MAEDVKTDLTPDEVRDADIAAFEKRRKRWAERFAERGATFDSDLRDVNPVFVRWYLEQSPKTREAIRQFWADEALAHPEIAHAHERAGHARMSLVISYAAEEHGYTP